MPWLFQDSQHIWDYNRQFKHFLQADKDICQIPLGLQTSGPGWAQRVWHPWHWVLSGLMFFVFTSSIYQMHPGNPCSASAEVTLLHSHTGILQDAFLSHLDHFSCMNSLDAVLLSVPVPLVLGCLILCFLASSMCSFTVTLCVVLWQPKIWSSTGVPEKIPALGIFLSLFFLLDMLFPAFFWQHLDGSYYS